MPFLRCGGGVCQRRMRVRCSRVRTRFTGCAFLLLLKRCVKVPFLIAFLLQSDRNWKVKGALLGCDLYLITL